MKRLWLMLSVLLVCLPLTSGCGYIVYTSGPYRGKVIDAETKTPIEGAVVLAVWYKTLYALVQKNDLYHAAAETLTDAQGEFTMPWSLGLSLNPFTWMQEPEFVIFKPGYKAYGTHGGWRLEPPGEGGLTVVELPKLKTREERLENLDRIILVDVPAEKQQTFLKLYNEERQALGLQPVRRL